MKNRLKIVISSGVIALAVVAAMVSPRSQILSKAEHVEQDCQVVDVGTMNNFVAYSSTRVFNQEKDVIEVDNNGCFLFNDQHSNVEVAYRVSAMPTSHHVTFVQRSQQTIWGSYSRYTGYALDAYAHGIWQLSKLGAQMTTEVSTYGIQANTNIWFRTVNCIDGSVHVKVDISVDGWIGRTTIFDIYDTEDPIFDNSTNGCHGLFNDNGAGELTISSINNKIEDAAPVSLLEISDPHPFNSGVVNITDDYIGINEPYNGGDSGVSFPLNYEGPLTYSVDITPKSKGTFDYTAFCFSVGATKTEASFPYPTQEGGSAWTSAGYIFIWQVNGEGTNDIYISRGIGSSTWNGTRISTSFLSPITFNLNQTYTATVSVTELPGGFVRLWMSIDGTMCIYFVDRPSDDGTYAPYHKPAGLSYANVYMRTQSSGRISATNCGTVAQSEKTIMSSALGNPVTNNVATASRNGDFPAFTSGTFGFDGLISNSNISGKLEFTSVGTSLSFLQNYSGTFGSWENKGYKVTAYPNGTIELYKNDALLCSASASNVFDREDKTFTFEYATHQLSNGNLIMITFKLDDVLVLKFLDTNSPVTSAGVFAVISNGYNGSLLRTAGTTPILKTNKAGNATVVGGDITLSIDNATLFTSIEYFIDTDSTTATYTMLGSVITPTSTGNIVAYALCDGIYSDDLIITVDQTIVVLGNLPDGKFEVGSDDFTIQPSLNNDQPISSIEYQLVGTEGVATISEGGTFHAIKAGVVQIKATAKDANDNTYNTREDSGYVYVVPRIALDTNSVPKGTNKVVNASFNCVIDESLVEYELAYGSEYATFNAETHTITGIKNGVATIRVVFARGTNIEVSKLFDISVVSSSIVAPVGPAIVGGPKVEFGASISDGSEITSIEYYVENLTGEATIDKQTGELTAIKAGTVNVYAIANGSRTETYTLSIAPKIEIGNTDTMALGAERDLGYYINCEHPNEDIEVFYELISGQENVVFNPATGHVKAVQIGQFTVRVTIVGDSFYAESALFTIAIEKPKVVRAGIVDDMLIGESQTLPFVLGNGEIPITSKSIIVISGGDCMEIDGFTVTAVKQGTFVYRVKINEYTSSEEYRIQVSSLVGVIGVSDMFVNDSQTLSIAFNTDNRSTDDVTYEIIEGKDLATIQGNVLTSLSNIGQIVIVAKQGTETVARATVNIQSICELTGITQGQYIKIGDTASLSYRMVLDGQAQTVVYSVVKGLATISGSTLTINGEGEIVVKVTVNGIDSETITVIGYDETQPIEPDDPDPVDAQITSIRVLAKPTKTAYEVGEQLELDGLVVVAVFDNDVLKLVTDYQVSGFDSSQPGTTTVTVTYGEFTTTFTLTIKETVLTGITLTQGPTKTEYIEGDELDLTGLVITGTYSNGTTAIITDYTVSGYDANKTGTQTVTITVDDHSVTVTVTVKEKENPDPGPTPDPDPTPDPEPDPTPKKKGCHGSITASLGIISLMSLVTFTLLQLKRREK